MTSRPWRPTARNGVVAAVAVLVLMVLLASCGREPESAALRVIPGADPDAGRAAMQDYGCPSCHVIPGVPGADGRVGPPLNELGRRKVIAGTLANTPENLIEWVRYPQSIRPGSVMPDMGVTEVDARNIASYLLRQR